MRLYLATVKGYSPKKGGNHLAPPPIIYNHYKIGLPPFLGEYPFMVAKLNSKAYFLECLTKYHPSHHANVDECIWQLGRPPLGVQILINVLLGFEYFHSWFYLLLPFIELTWHYCFCFSKGRKKVL